MRILGLVLVMAVGATIAVYTPVKNLYPPRHEVLALVVKTVPQLGDYVPAALLTPTDEASLALLAPESSRDEQGADADPAAMNTDVVSTEALNSTEADGVWTGFQAETLGLLLGDMGFATERTMSDDGEEMILVNRDERLDFGLVLKACGTTDRADACSGLQIAAIVFQDIDDGVVASMNRRHDALKFSKMDGGDLHITRYLTADYGIAPANVQANIAAFVDILDLYMGTG